MVWYRAALLCGLLPMLLGTAIFAAWLVTDHGSLEIAGLLLIYGGILLLGAGLVSLRLYLSHARRGGIAGRRPAVWALALLLANLPLCAAYVFIAFAMESAHHVTLVNRASKSIEALVLTDPTGRRFPVGTIGPGQVRQVCPDFSGEGAVEFSLTIDGESRTGTLIGYLADPLGSRSTLLLTKVNTTEASETFERISLVEFLRHCVIGDGS